MSTFASSSVLAICVLLVGQTAHAATNTPSGSYNLTCKNISVNAAADTLSAICVKLDNQSQATTLPKLTACMNSITQNGDIANLDGNLVCMPDLPKPDSAFVFPQSETQINQWIYSGNNAPQYAHSWGIWSGLTQGVGIVDGVPVRAFETWPTPSEMIYQIQSGQAGLFLGKQLNIQPRHLKLSLPHQFRNVAAAAKEKAALLKAASSSDGDTNIFVSVAYNPPAAKHAVSNKLFLQSTLDQYLKEGYTDIPNFPSNAITIKPVYKVIPKNIAGGIYTFPGWPGTPVPAKTFPEQDWNACVYVDILHTGKGGNGIDQGCKGRTPASTFYLNDFIHQQITKDDATYLTQQLGLQVSEGDYAILVGMHVTTREIKRWVWQTFFWSANADSPYAPSSTAIAQARPMKYLDTAAAHYAMAIAYQMVTPAQPITGGTNSGSSLIAYNPHLEASFDPGVFQYCASVGGQYSTPSAANCKLSDPSINRFGVQTNCMTCHHLAMYNPKIDYNINQGANRETPYGTNFYMSLTDPAFNGALQLDFAWSLLGSMVSNSGGTP